MGFLKGIKPSTFLDTHQEWHALIEGFSDGFCIRKARYEPWDGGNDDENLLKSLRKEHHYYNIGRVPGFASFIILVTGMIAWIIGAVI